MAFQSRASDNDGWVQRDGLAIFYPRNANAATITQFSNAKYNFGFTPWTVVTAGTLESFALHGMQLSIKTSYLASFALHGVVQIGTGTNGNEVVIGETSYVNSGALSGATSSAVLVQGTSFTKWFSPLVLPKGTRIVIRANLNALASIASIDLAAYLIGYAQGNVSSNYSPYSLKGYLSGVEKGHSVVYPNEHNININGTAFPTYSAYTQIVAAVPADTLVVAVNSQPTSTISARNHYVEIATGANPNEVSRARVAFPGLGFANGGIATLPRPLFVKQGERISIRVTGTAASNFSLECVSLQSDNTTTSTTTTSTSTTSSSTTTTTTSTTTTTTSTTSTTTTTSTSSTSTTITTTSTTTSTSSSTSTTTTVTTTSTSTTTL